MWGGKSGGNGTLGAYDFACEQLLGELNDGFLGSLIAISDVPTGIIAVHVKVPVIVPGEEYLNVGVLGESAVILQPNSAFGQGYKIAGNHFVLVALRSNFRDATSGAIELTIFELNDGPAGILQFTIKLFLDINKEQPESVSFLPHSISARTARAGRTGAAGGTGSTGGTGSGRVVIGDVNIHGRVGIDVISKRGGGEQAHTEGHDKEYGQDAFHGLIPPSTNSNDPFPPIRKLLLFYHYVRRVSNMSAIFYSILQILPVPNSRWRRRWLRLPRNFSDKSRCSRMNGPSMRASRLFKNSSCLPPFA